MANVNRARASSAGEQGRQEYYRKTEADKEVDGKEAAALRESVQQAPTPKEPEKK